MRVVSYNIHGGTGADGRREIVRAAELLERLQADVIGLQEVEGRPARSAVDQAHVLADRLGMTLVPGPLLFEKETGYGNALLTRWPVAMSRCRLLPGRGREPRGFIDADVHHPRSGTWRVLVAHLDLRWRSRQRQLSALAALLRRHDHGPIVLLADHNEWAAFAPGMRRLRAALGFCVAPRSFPAGRPLLRLDAVAGRYCRPATAAAAARLAGAARISDHLPVVADLRPHPAP